MTDLERAARALYEEIGFVRGVDWPPPSAGRYRNGMRAALRALLPPSEEAVKAVADAIAPHFSGADRAYKEHHVCANDAITAYITFIAGEGK